MIYIVASTFYKALSDELVSGAKSCLMEYQHTNFINKGLQCPEKFFIDDFIDKKTHIEVPGAYEIPGMVKQLLDNKQPSLIITLGVIIKGETNHFEQISEFVFESISKLSISSGVPISFGVISALNSKQAEERALISKRNKGAEVANAGLKMLELYDQYKK
jgi:6,7-dimethyl-8-ribityllumazine synthase